MTKNEVRNIMTALLAVFSLTSLTVLIIAFNGDQDYEPLATTTVVEVPGPIQYQERLVEVRSPADRRKIKELAQRLEEAMIEIDSLKAESAELDMAGPADSRLGLSFKHQAILTSHIKNFAGIPADGEFPSDYEARRRADIIRNLVDDLVGRDRRMVIEEQLRAEAREHGNDSLAFAAKNPFHQQLFGFLCFPPETR